MPNTKQMESRILDFPEPFKPVMALNSGSQSLITVRVAYDLKPSSTSSSTNIDDPETPVKLKRRIPKKPNLNRRPNGLDKGRHTTPGSAGSSEPRTIVCCKMVRVPIPMTFPSLIVLIFRQGCSAIELVTAISNRQTAWYTTTAAVAAANPCFNSRFLCFG